MFRMCVVDLHLHVLLQAPRGARYMPEPSCYQTSCLSCHPGNTHPTIVLRLISLIIGMFWRVGMIESYDISATWDGGEMSAAEYVEDAPL